MTESVVSFAVDRLSALLIQEANLLRGVKGQVVQMQSDLKFIHSCLKDADKRQDEDERVRVWVSEIRDVAYAVEDAIETYAFEVASRRGGGIRNAFKRCACIINKATELHKADSDIQDIKARISTLRTNSEIYDIRRKSEGEGSSSAHETRRRLRQSYSHVVEEYTVGLDEDIKNLVGKLVKEEEPCRVVPIYGMGGLGKTTLAKKIYHHDDIRDHFDGFAWAYVSQQFQPKDVWEGILFKLISPSDKERKKIVKLRDDELAKKLYKVQLDKKCLVILDDIWTSEAWDILSPAFPLGKAGSKMLLTTRHKNVAQHVDDGRGFLHEPRCLTEEQGWNLLLKKAFPKNDTGFKIDTKREKLGREIVGRCEGLPLAIVVLGGLLATKNDWNEWRMVHENINSYLRIGKGHEQQHSSLYEQVLNLSYHELPCYLKPCFLHLAHFPENFDIPTKKLVRIWVAEGLVSRMPYDLEGKQPLEDVARHHLDELLDRGMVQVGARGSSGRVKTCRLHDVMRDLCMLKANQESFIKFVRIQDGNKSLDPPSMETILKSSCQVHRLAIHLGKESYKNISWECEITPYLRSLLFFSTYYGRRIPQKMKLRFSDFKLLKILDLERCRISGKLARAIGNLIHLRYLNLSLRNSTNLPSSFGNLRWLQTLIIQPLSINIGVPNVIWKMEWLSHLYLPVDIRKSCRKLRLGNLRYLQTLHGFDSRRCDVTELIKLTNLKKLKIVHLKSLEELVESVRSPSDTLKSLCSLDIDLKGVNSIIEETGLQRLLLPCLHLSKLTLRGRIGKLPKHLHFPLNLNKLTLDCSDLEKDPMATLEKLPNLSILRLKGAFIGEKMVCSSEGFPKLKSLILYWLPNLEEWRVDDGAMPGLCELVIEACSKLKMVPDGLNFITTLRELQIIRMPVEFKNMLQGGKVSHQRSIIFK